AVSNAVHVMSRKDGSAVSVSLSCQRAGDDASVYVGSLTDVSSLVRATDGDLYSSAPVGIYRIAPDGRAISANAAFLSMLGYASEQEMRDAFRADAIYADSARREALMR